MKQVTNYGLCGECKYHRHDNRPNNECKDWYCGNPRSEYYMDYTDYSDSCEDWEERE